MLGSFGGPEFSNIFDEVLIEAEGYDPLVELPSFCDGNTCFTELFFKDTVLAGQLLNFVVLIIDHELKLFFVIFELQDDALIMLFPVLHGLVPVVVGSCHFQLHPQPLYILPVLPDLRGQPIDLDAGFLQIQLILRALLVGIDKFLLKMLPLLFVFEDGFLHEFAFLFDFLPEAFFPFSKVPGEHVFLFVEGFLLFPYQGLQMLNLAFVELHLFVCLLLLDFNLQLVLVVHSPQFPVLFFEEVSFLSILHH